MSEHRKLGFWTRRLRRVFRGIRRKPEEQQQRSGRTDAPTSSMGTRYYDEQDLTANRLRNRQIGAAFRSRRG